MSDIKSFWVGFLSRGGGYVVSSSMSVRVVSLIASILVVRALEKTDYAAVSYAVLVITILSPLVAGSMSRTVLRFGGLESNVAERAALYKFYFSKGLILTIFLALLLALSVPIVCINNPESVSFLYVLSVILILDYCYMMFQSKLRLTKKNKQFALMSFLRALFFLVLALALIPELSGMGYATGLVLAPLLALLFMSVYIRSAHTNQLWGSAKKGNSTPGVCRFGLFSGFSGAMSKLQITIDALFVANLMSDGADLATYRVAALLPMSIAIFPEAFFKTEYVHLTENYTDKKYVKKYLKNYFFLMLPICLLMVMGAYFFGGPLLSLVFGDKYIDAAPVFTILVFGVSGVFLLRQPFGNLNSVSGRVDLNMINGVVSLLISSLLLYFLLPVFGLVGAAASSAIVLWLSGLIGASFYYFNTFVKLK